MSMCAGCKTAADRAAEDRLVSVVMRLTTGGRADLGVIRHPCQYPHTCTCQHNRRMPVRTGALAP